ncbi:MAG: hypothetical protein R6W82_11475 [bacterium]
MLSHRRTARLLLPLLVVPLLEGCGGTEIAEEAAEVLAPRTTGSEAAALVSVLAPLSRYPATEGYDEALETISRRLGEEGFPLLAAPPPDGPPPAGLPTAYRFTLSDSIPYPVWHPGPARLEVVGEEGFVAADTRRNPMVLGMFSAPTPEGGLTTRLINLGNGTYDAEYEGVDVRGALVYGRQPLQSVLRAAVERGAAGAVSPAAPVWQGTEEHPGLVAFGRASPRGIGFKVSSRTARRLESAMAAGGGAVPVRAEVSTSRAGGERLQVLAAEIKGRAETSERAVFAAPLSGPAPGMQDVSGAAVLVEAALAIRHAIEGGHLPRPRRSILFLWGAGLETAREWEEAYPGLMLYAHSATVVQFVGRRIAGTDHDLLVERVPDPSAVWNRGLFPHTPWGPSRPPHWPFDGHYLSEYSGLVVRRTLPAEGWSWGFNPYEGGADHMDFLEERVPAQRLWHFPDPLYRSSLDSGDRAEPEMLGEAALAAGVMAYELGLAEPNAARKILEHLEARAREVLAENIGTAAANLDSLDTSGLPPGRRSPRRRLEEDVLNAWKIWYLEAMESIMAHPLGPEAGQLDHAVSRAVWRLDADWDMAMEAIGLAPLPLPERMRRGTVGRVR